jgi:hypothetical protein
MDLDLNNDIIIISDDDTNSDTDSENNSVSSYYFLNEDLYDEMFDNITIDNDNFLDSDKEDKKYYLGICSYYKERILMDSVILSKNFLKYDIKFIEYYLRINRSLPHSIFTSNNKYINIMKLDIDEENGYYNIIIKTYWIRIIQRTWKNVFKKRQEILMKRKNINNLKYRETRGKHSDGLNILPSLYGMLKFTSYK